MAGKAQIVDQLVTGGATRAQAAAAVDAVLDAITASLAAGERVTLTGFGTFEPAERSARTARNPRTGSSVEVAATTVARFRPGTALRAAVAGGPARGVAARPAPGASGGGDAAGTSDVVGAAAGTSGAATGSSKGKDRDDPEGGKHGPAATGEAPAGAASVVTRKADTSTTKASAAAGKKRTKDDKPSGKNKGKGKTKGKKDASPAKSGKKRAKK